jgi:hypothetical protein
MARKTTALVIEMKRCVRAMCVRACGDDGRMCDEECTRGAAAEEQEKRKDEMYVRIRMSGRIARCRNVTTN